MSRSRLPALCLVSLVMAAGTCAAAVTWAATDPAAAAKPSAVARALVGATHEASAKAAAPANGRIAAVDAAAVVDGLFAPLAGKALPGASVVIVRDGQVVHSKAYGLASVQGNEPNSTRTRFRLASVTKSFTALAVLQLVEQGRLSLDDPLEKYVPGFAGGDRMQLRYVLSHTAGLPDFMSVEQAMKTPPDGAPGERLNYSNIGYAALGRLIQKVTGRSYGEHLRLAIFEPLGMKDTGVDGAEPSDRGDAVGYLFTPDGGVTKAEYSVTAGDPAAGGLHSTAEDMARFVQALLAGRVVKPSTLEQAFTPVTLAGGRTGRYGFGFMTRPYRGLPEAGHGGDISGFNSYVAIYPTERLAVVVLSNVGMRPPGPLPTAGDIAHRIVAALLADRLGPEFPAAATLPPATLQRYAGRYRLLVPPPVAEVMGDAIQIRIDGTRVLASGKQGEAEIFPESETRFFSKQGPVEIDFSVSSAGVPTGGVLSLMGVREFRLEREP